MDQLILLNHNIIRHSLGLPIIDADFLYLRAPISYRAPEAMLFSKNLESYKTLLSPWHEKQLTMAG